MKVLCFLVAAVFSTSTFASWFPNTPPKTKGRYSAVSERKCGPGFRPVRSMDECARAVSALWPVGFGMPCRRPVWRDNIMEVNQPHNPKGCFILRNNSNGCGLEFNPTGRGSVCSRIGVRGPSDPLECTVVCVKDHGGGQPARPTNGEWHHSCKSYMIDALKKYPRDAQEVEGMRWNVEPVSWRACVEAYQNGGN